MSDETTASTPPVAPTTPAETPTPPPALPATPETSATLGTSGISGVSGTSGTSGTSGVSAAETAPKPDHAEDHHDVDDPHSIAEADKVADEPDLHVDQKSLEGADEKPDPKVDEGEASPVSKDVPASEDPHAAGVDTGSDKPLEPVSDKAPSDPTSAPAAPEKAAETEAEKTPEAGPFDGLHDVAKPLEKVVSEQVIMDLEDAACCLWHARNALNEADLTSLDPELSALVGNLRNQSAGILAALEGLYRRVG